MSSEQAQQMLDLQRAAAQYAQDVSVSAAQVNSAAQVQVHATMYLLGAVILLGLLIAGLLRPRNRGV